MEFENEIELKKMVNFCVDHELKGEGLAIYEVKITKSTRTLTHHPCIEKGFKIP